MKIRSYLTLTCLMLSGSSSSTDPNNADAEISSYRATFDPEGAPLYIDLV